jgi:hypothetical protein
MKERQNNIEGLRLLVAQRRLYSRSKRWLAVRTVGMLVIAIIAPPVSVLWPDLAVVAGAVSGLWIFVGRTVLIHLETRAAGKAAAVQEMFDTRLFAMPSLGRRSPSPSLEEISIAAGGDRHVLREAEEQRLLDWYEIDASQDGFVAVAICQRANASYSDRLLRTYANWWIAAVTCWAGLLIAAGIGFKLSLSVFLLGVVLPLLPAFLDAVRYWHGLRRAAADRRELMAVIESKLSEEAVELAGEGLLVWQSRLYNLRKEAPQVPNFLYWMHRKKNELAMRVAANQLSSRVKRKDK